MSLASMSLAWSQALPGGAPTAAPAVQVAALSPVVVTATRHPVRADELVSEVVVIERQQIEDAAARTLPELLAREAGVQFTSTGGVGKVSGVFIRGAESRHTVLLIDGVRSGSATAGIPIWDAVPLELIERIEVLKGPASALYGSEGVGGVVQVFTRRGQAGYRPYAAVSAGSAGLAQATAGTSGAKGVWSYAFGVQGTRERGISASNVNGPFGIHDPDRDGFRQSSVSASLGLKLGEQWRVDASLLHSSGITRFDDGPGLDARSRIRSDLGSIGVKGRIGEAWQTELRYGHSTDLDRAIEGAWLPSEFRTVQEQWTWQNTVATPWGTALLGAERREQRVDGSTVYDVGARSIDAVFAGLNGQRGAHSWQANLRRDRNSQFGGSTTGFAGYGYRLGGGWRVHASHGTSFVAPNFNQLYYPGFSNPALQPERGRNTELGLSYSAAGHDLRLARFDNRIRGYITNTTLPQNVRRSRIEGWTLAYQGAVGASSRLRASVDALDPRNEQSGALLPRRARQQVTLGVDTRAGAWRLGTSLLHVGARFDDAANIVPLAGYTTIDAQAELTLPRDWKLQFKLGNLTDRRYETANGYNQPGRNGAVTLRWQPR
ncbi:MAG: TonB-dependent receptor domain-containing protein [Burkholderiaceae bacterium]